MKNYYHQKGVRQAIIDFVYSGYPSPIREGAFFNEKIGEIQRHSPNNGENSVLVMDSEEKFAQTLRAGAKAFYASYWRYSKPSEASGFRGRDLAWSIKADEGGLPVAKEMTSLFLEALEKEGFPHPLIKYSGKLGFDVLIPLEDIQTGSPDDLDFLSEVHKNLTETASDYIKNQSSFDTQDKTSQLRFSNKKGTCLLTELRWSRGLLLAPMSLHPGSGLVSVPLLPSEVPEFSVIDASPENVQLREWSIAETLPRDRTEALVGNSSTGVPIHT